MAPDDDKTQTHVPITSGTMVSHYRIIEKIGSGGMGEVYLAQDTKLDRQVALKFLPSDCCKDDGIRARFQRGAQAAAKLNHPNIVTIHEVSEFNGRPFFAMEHIDGLPLDAHVKDKKLPLNDIINLSLQIAEGLGEAHRCGITHRDIKPANMLVDKKGRVKILDFGLAAIKGTDKLTKTGSTLGTLHYMSPEQTRGEELDNRSDIFSFGVVLYEMVTGQLPFTGDHEPAIIYSIGYEEPEPLARFKTGVPDELQRIVGKMLAKDKSIRYQHADELAADLKRLTTSEIKPQTPRRDLWNRYVVTAAVAVILAIVGYWGVMKFLAKDGQKLESARKMLAVLPFENLCSPEDEYFADGITDEITGKLAAIRDLGVISRTSTMQYKKTTKNIRQIAKELGVDYILEGTIRWDKRDDTSRVRILPQLIKVSDDTHLWAETYQRPLTDVFAIQTEIASCIAEVMSITLRESEGAKLKSIPTTSMEAYDSYLRGINAWTIDDRGEDMRFAVQMFERAVAIDSTFALAYAELAIVHAGLYNFLHDPTAERQDRARMAAARAIALQPGLARGHLAMACYYYWCLRAYNQALTELSLAEEEQANDARILEIKALIWRRQGKFAAAIEHLKMAFRLDPRRVSLPANIGQSYAQLRDYGHAQAYLDSAIHLAPDVVWAYAEKSQNFIYWRGDLAQASRILASIPRQDDERARYAWSTQYRLERNFPGAIEQALQIRTDTGELNLGNPTKLTTLGMLYALLKDRDRSRAHYDSARVILERQIPLLADASWAHSLLGVVYAGLGRREEAVREGRLAVELCPISGDAVSAPAMIQALAMIYVLVEDYDAALDQIETLLSISDQFSVHWLKADPDFDPLRHLPRYQRILEKYGA